MRKPTRRDLDDRTDPSARNEGVVLLGDRQWNRNDMRRIGSDIVRASLRSGKAIVLREFVTKDGVWFKPHAAKKTSTH